MNGYLDGMGSTIKYLDPVDTADHCYDYVKKNHPYADGFIWNKQDHGCFSHIGISNRRDSRRKFIGCHFAGH